jgi:hypothetical protein
MGAIFSYRNRTISGGLLLFLYESIQIKSFPQTLALALGYYFGEVMVHTPFSSLWRTNGWKLRLGEFRTRNPENL